MGNTFDVLCVGLALGNIIVRPVPKVFDNGDTVQVENIEMIIGGDAFNQASVLSALGHKTSLVSKVGNDSVRDLMLELIGERGIDGSHLSVDPEVGSSNCVILVHPDGQRNFCTFKGCLRTFGEQDFDLSIVNEAKIVSIGGLFALPSFDQKASISLFREAKKAGKITVCDTKYDAFHIGLKGIHDLLEYTDYFFPSYDEAVSLSGCSNVEDMARFFRDRGAGHVGIKLGGDGCYVCDDDFKGKLPPFESEVIDTTGAGDNFMAGLIHGLLSGLSFADSAVYANAAGALAVTRIGATSNEEYTEHIFSILSQTAEGKRVRGLIK